MCTTANINAYREVPPGRGGLSFSFDPDHATLRGPGPDRIGPGAHDRLRGAGRPAPVHAVRRVRHQRGGLLPADGLGDAAGLPDPVHGHRPAAGCLAAASGRGQGRATGTRRPGDPRTGPPQRPLVARARAAAVVHGASSDLADGGTRPGAEGGAAVGLRAEAAQRGTPAQQYPRRPAVPRAAADPGHAVRRGRRAHQLPQHVDVRHRRRALRQPGPGRGPATGARDWALPTSWCSTPAATRRTPGSPWAGPSRWPGPTRAPRSCSIPRR